MSGEMKLRNTRFFADLATQGAAFYQLDHFNRCSMCNQYVDERDIADVRRHSIPGHDARQLH